MQYEYRFCVVVINLLFIVFEGVYPSFPLFARLVTMFNISADQYLFTEGQAEKTSLRRQIDSILDTFEDKELIIIEGTAKGICRAKESME